MADPFGGLNATGFAMLVLRLPPGLQFSLHQAANCNMITDMGRDAIKIAPGLKGMLHPA
jgi:hypothetical protein